MSSHPSSKEPDSLLKIAEDAIDALIGEESTTESQFGIGNPNENYHEESDALQARLAALTSDPEVLPDEQ